MKREMTEVRQMTQDEAVSMLGRTSYGHLGCSLDGQPYVVPINFEFDNGCVYFYTTEGKKSEMITANPMVCLQVEDVVDNGVWQSVVILGIAEKIQDDSERETALDMILASNPTLTPAISIVWDDNWVRENVEAVYRIQPTSVTGRIASTVKIQAAYAPKAGHDAIPN